MTAKTESVVRNRAVTRRSDMYPAGDGAVEARNGAVEQPARPAQGAQDARASRGPAGTARRGKPTTRQMVVYAIAAGAVARLPFDRRFQTAVIMLAIRLILGKNIVKAASKDVVVGVERYYLGIQPRSLHLRRGRRQRPRGVRKAAGTR